MIEQLEELFRHRGAEAYLGEAVTVAEHMLQCAALASSEGAEDALVAAALLHDIGHMTGPLGEYTPEDTTDRRHDAYGAEFLDGHFPLLVVESVRLHVEAKRYLCTIDETYFGKLSEPSQHSFKLQGGPMSSAEKTHFEMQPFHREAIRVRLWDDAGKVAGARIPDFSEFLPLLRRIGGD